jgi:long-chain acyl-CoA synthetase
MAEISDFSSAFPWNASYPQEVNWQGPLEIMPVYNLFESSVKKYGKQTAIEFLGRKYSYLELGDLVNKFAKGLQQLGVTKGTKVGLMLPNCPCYVIGYYAALKLGAIIVNYNPLYAMRELQHQIDDSNTTIMITVNIKTIYHKVMTLLRSTCMEHVVIADLAAMLPWTKKWAMRWQKADDLAFVAYDVAKLSFEKLLENDGHIATIAIDPERDCALLQYTGGTTGTPKAAILTHANIVANIQQSSLWFHAFEQQKETLLAILPLFHVFAMTVAMNFSLYKGAKLVLLPKFDIEQLVETLIEQKVSFLPVVPTILVALTRYLEENNTKFPHLKSCISGGAPLPVDLKHSAESLLQCNIVEGYGLTEASPVITVNPPSDKNKSGSVGLPLPKTIVEIRTSDSNLLLSQGMIGEICVKGPQVMQGYWNQQEETNRTLQDGLLHTGDLGYMDDEGYLFVLDRIKEVILVGGLNVYPRRIEEILREHPGVNEVAVIGVTDEYKGQKVKAFIVTRNGQTIAEESLKKFASGRLAPFEVPSEFSFVPELPKTLIGKVSKRELSNLNNATAIPHLEDAHSS